MSNPNETAFLVNAYSDPVAIKIDGKASYLNCSPVSDFIDRMIAQGKRRFVLDFDRCTGMDSTFLGIIAGAALNLRTTEPSGNIVLCRLNARNMELVRNLGLHKIVTVDGGGSENDYLDEKSSLSTLDKSEIEQAKMILRAHENLVQIDESNQAKFQDVISFLRNQVDPS